ncbi:MAG: phosphotransferase family protein [Acidimicrobiia bacterium]
MAKPPAAERLADAVGRHLAAPVRIEGLRRLSGGASRETWTFDAAPADGGTPLGLVLRRDPGADAGPGARAAEFELILAADPAGVPVPAARFLLEPGDDLGTGFVMDRIEGETIPRKILRDDQYASARPRLARQCGEILARLHTLGPGVAALPTLSPRELLDQYREILDGLGEPHPAFELGLRWLAERVPDNGRTTLVHGDFRNGNLVVGSDGVRAVLDWELAHFGDPMEDLGWLCVKSWRFGVVDKLVGGFGDLDDLFAAYEDAGGAPVDPEAVGYWIAFGTLKWGVICEMQAFAHLHGIVRSVEQATIGRRVAEMEWDLLDLLA